MVISRNLLKIPFHNPIQDYEKSIILFRIISFWIIKHQFLCLKFSNRNHTLGKANDQIPQVLMKCYNQIFCSFDTHEILPWT
jgi:hypothetical protein